MAIYTLMIEKIWKMLSLLKMNAFTSIYYIRTNWIIQLINKKEQKKIRKRKIFLAFPTKLFYNRDVLK